MSTDIRQITEKEFPPLLKEIPDSPQKLYVRGTLPPFEHAWLAVVGSRKYSSYGKDVTKYLIEGLRGAPIVVVSGLALGIDSLAHKAALAANLPTVAVPGSGLDESVLYPRTNLSLAKDIVASGSALVSEFEPTFSATPWSFPRRNRLMAGMTHATLLIEAAPQSGTLITARLASDYNRDVFVVPHSIFTEGSKGVHQFLSLGATPITTSDDILHALNITREETLASKTNADLSLKEQRVYELLIQPQSKDDLIRQLGITTAEAQILLTKMELHGLIEEHMGTIRKT